jgi:hypothetical protein
MRISEVEPITIKYVDDEQDEVSAAAVTLLSPVRRAVAACSAMPYSVPVLRDAIQPSAVSCAGSFVTPRAHP